MKTTTSFFAAAALSMTVACASTSPDGAFRDTQGMVKNRIGEGVHWYQGGPSDAEAGQYVRTLLSRPLSVDSAVRIALFNNRDLQATYEELQISQADLVQAGLLKNPTVGGSLALPVEGDVATGGSVSVTEDFIGLFTIAARRRIAKSALEAAKLRVAGAVVEAAFDVKSAYFQLQSALQVRSMRRTILEAGDAALDLARRQHEAGNSSELDLANEETLYEQVRADLLRSDVEVAAARESLTRLLGLWGPNASYAVDEKLPELPATEVTLDHLESLAVSRRLDLLAAHADAETSSEELAAAKNFRWLGSASVGGFYERAPERYSTVGPSASVELPLFDQKQAEVARLEAKLRAALAREQSVAVDVRSEVRETRAKLVARRAFVERYEQVVVPLRRRVVDLSQQQYDAMLLGAYQLLQAKQNEVNAYRELIESLRDYWIARAELERATGGTLTSTTQGTK